LNHRQRLNKLINREKTDRPAVALWRHFPVDDQTPDGLAAATTAFQRTFDFDLVKITPSSSFCLKDWGAEDRWNGDSEGTRRFTRFVIHKPEDWLHLPVLDPTRGHLGSQLECARLLVNEFTADTPVLQTVFSPLAQAKNLVGPEQLSVHLRKYPEAVLAGLKTISETTIQFIEALKKTGVDGIFYAVQHAQLGIFSEAEFSAYSKPFDLQILNTTGDFWLNMVHLHGENVMFDLVANYPVQIINWHDRHTWPSLAESQQHFQGIVCGGLRRIETMVLGTAQDVTQEALEAVQQAGENRFILGTGCVVPITAPYGNWIAARRSVEPAWKGV
jgi:uroporphyrinogen decarboxylase